MHNQNVDITPELERLKNQVAVLGMEKHAIHAGPIIRREVEYKHIERKERQKIFNILCHFIRQVDVHYVTAAIEKFPE